MSRSVPPASSVSEVVITADRPLVQKDLTSTSVTVSSEDIRLMPVENVDQVINLQAGVVGGHFRGGRSDEVLYLVDGVSVTDPFNNSRGITVENSSIRQMEVISGAFNAEYGQAMSGVVNIVTQEGSAVLSRLSVAATSAISSPPMPERRWRTWTRMCRWKRTTGGFPRTWGHSKGSTSIPSRGHGILKARSVAPQ